MPSIKSKIERMFDKPPQSIRNLKRPAIWIIALGLQARVASLNGYHVISLPAPDSRGETRAKRAK
jgi:hypothetical protein